MASDEREIPDKYAGACWNALMEEETKESIAEMLMDGMDERRKLKAELAKSEAALAEMQKQHERTLECLRVSEDFRTAYQDGKYKLYAMGGAICEAAADNLPMGEGPLDRACRKEVGRPQIRAEVAALESVSKHRDELLEALKAPVSDEEWELAREQEEDGKVFAYNRDIATRLIASRAAIQQATISEGQKSKA